MCSLDGRVRKVEMTESFGDIRNWGIYAVGFGDCFDLIITVSLFLFLEVRSYVINFSVLQEPIF